MGVMAVSSNAQKPTQKVKQNKETGEYVPNESQHKTSKDKFNKK